MNISLKLRREILQTLLEAGPAADVFNLSFSTSLRCLKLRCQSEWRAAARRLQLAAALLSVHILKEVARLEAALSQIRSWRMINGFDAAQLEQPCV